MSRILLVIDLQRQFKDDNGQYEKCLKYISEYKDKYDRIVGTLFRNTNDSMYEKKLDYGDCKKTSILDLDYRCYDEILIKNGYITNIDSLVSRMKDCVIDIIGCDADACVLATVFSLWDKGYNFNILTDYIYTTSKDIDKEDILRIMKRNFGKCVK